MVEKKDDYDEEYSNSSGPRAGDRPRERETVVRYFPVDRRDVQMDFVSFLGQENIDRLGTGREFSFKKQLNTRFGDVELNITYRAQYSDIYIYLPDTQTTGLSMRIELDKQFNPKVFVLIDDKTSYFTTLFAETGLSQFSRCLGTTNPEVFQRTLQKQVDYQTTTKMLIALTTDIKRRTDITETYSGESGIFVEQDHFKIATIETPLATAGINTCAGLIVIDRAEGTHYLAHVSPITDVNAIKKSLETFGDLEDQEIYFMEGMTPSGTVQNILTAILDNPKALEKVRFLSGGEGLFNGVVIYNGKIFSVPQDINDWRQGGNRF